MSGTTEDSILKNIPDFADGGDDGQVEGGSDTQGTSSTPASGSESGGDGRSSAPPTQTGGTGSGDDRSAQQVQRRHDGLVEVPGDGSTRDLVDPVTGRTVAKGGIERRVFEEGQRHARENNQLKQQLGAVQRQVQSGNQVMQEATRLNISPEDHMVAIRVMSDFLRDPVRTLGMLVEEVKSKGYPIPFLQEGVNPGMDLNAISRMIDNKLQPLTQEQQRNQQQVQLRQQAERELQGFLAENPEGNANLDVLTEMLQAQPDLSLHAAYTKMIRWAHANGLDWSRPLKQQLGQPQQPNSQQPEPQPRQIPGRRSASGNGAAPVGNNAPMSENASWGDIIRQAMQDHGVQLN